MTVGVEAALASYLRGEYEAAKDLLAGAGERGIVDSSDLDAVYLRGLCAVRCADWEEALTMLEQVVTSDPDFARVFQCRMALAFIYSVTGRRRLAEYELETLVRGGLESAQVYAAYGHVMFLDGDYERSVEYYKKALEYAPESPTALNGLGYVYAEAGSDLKKALIYCKKAVDLGPDNPAYLDSLAWAYHKLGLKKDALATIDRALKKANGNETIVKHARIISES